MTSVKEAFRRGNIATQMEEVIKRA